MEGNKEEIKYPRVHISVATHKILKRVAKKEKMSLKKLGNKVVRAGLRSLGYTN